MFRLQAMGIIQCNRKDGKNIIVYLFSFINNIVIKPESNKYTIQGK